MGFPAKKTCAAERRSEWDSYNEGPRHPGLFVASFLYGSFLSPKISGPKPYGSTINQNQPGPDLVA